MRGVLFTLFVGALCSACAAAAPGGAAIDDLATVPGPGPVDLATAAHDLAPHDLAGASDLALPSDLSMLPLDAGATCVSCTLTLVGGTIAALRSDGSSYDSGGGLADAYVNVQLSGGASKRSSTKSDVTTVSWNEVMFSGLSQAQILGGFTLEVMDDDPLNPDDSVASWAVSPTAAQLAAGSITLTSGSGAGMTTTITLSIH